MMVRIFDKMKSDRKKLILSEAENLLNKILNIDLLTKDNLINFLKFCKTILIFEILEA